jgi:hypothetical protein
MNRPINGTINGVFMCALGDCKEQCYTCKIDEKIDHENIINRLNRENVERDEKAKTTAMALLDKYTYLLNTDIYTSTVRHCAEIVVNQILGDKLVTGLDEDFYLKVLNHIRNLPH